MVLQCRVSRARYSAGVTLGALYAISEGRRFLGREPRAAPSGEFPSVLFSSALQHQRCSTECGPVPLVLIRAIFAVIHAVLQAVATALLAMTSVALVAVLVIGALVGAVVLGITGFGGARFARGRRRKNKEP